MEWKLRIVCFEAGPEQYERIFGLCTMYMRDKRFVDGAHKLEAIVDVEPFRTLIGHSNSAIEKEKVE